MDSKRAEEIRKSSSVVNVSYNGMPVWIEAIKGDAAEVTLVGMKKRIDVSVSALTEADPMKTM